MGIALCVTGSWTLTHFISFSNSGGTYIQGVGEGGGASGQPRVMGHHRRLPSVPACAIHRCVFCFAAGGRYGSKCMYVATMTIAHQQRHRSVRAVDFHKWLLRCLAAFLRN